MFLVNCTQNIFYQAKILDRNQKYSLIYKSIFPSQTVIGKFFAKPLAKGFSSTVITGDQ